MTSNPNRTYTNSIITILIALWGASVAVWVSAETTTDSNPHAKVLSIGGSVTEIVFALGQGHRLIARDTTSIFPPRATELPDVGYVRALSPEGVLSVGPELIISEDGAGPPEAVEILKAASIPFVTIPDDYSGKGVVQKIIAVGEALDVEDKAAALAESVATDLAKAKTHSASVTEPKRVLFILSTQGGRILASGTNTAADGIIRMAGGVNAISEFEGYKPLSDEAVSAAAPDVILMMDRGGNHGAADDELFAMPALVTTPAAQSRSVVRMDGLYMLGFGPRTAEAVLDLNTALYDG